MIARPSVANEKTNSLEIIPIDPDRYPAYPGEVLKARYRVLRKLGHGNHAEIWLIEDQAYAAADDAKPAAGYGVKYLAVKVLTADATLRHSTGQVREAHFLEMICAEAGDKSWGLPVLLDHFTVSGPGGQHLCFVMHVFGGSISKFRRMAPNKALPLHIVKTIILQLLDCLKQLHKWGIIHAGIKPENILINCVKGDDDVERYLQDPPEIEGYFELPASASQADPADTGGIDPPDISQLSLDDAGTSADHSQEQNGVVRHPYLRAQPLPLPISWDGTPKDAELLTITLVDFGKSQQAGTQPTLRYFAPLALRSPEEILGSYFGPKVDIWAVGCIAFELLTGRWLFHPEAGETWSVDDDHLAKMLELTGDKFSPQMLDFSQDAETFFDEEGNLLRIDELLSVPLEKAISVYNILPEEAVKPAADFIRACLKLDPLQRPGASELEKHPWLSNAFSC